MAASPNQTAGGALDRFAECSLGSPSGAANGDAKNPARTHRPLDGSSLVVERSRSLFVRRREVQRGDRTRSSDCESCRRERLSLGALSVEAGLRRATSTASRCEKDAAVRGPGGIRRGLQRQAETVGDRGRSHERCVVLAVAPRGSLGTELSMNRNSSVCRVALRPGEHGRRPAARCRLRAGGRGGQPRA
jgi:hypothetical protein